MFCPQCSQRQISEEMRFCSGCGFPLEVVSQLVRNGGVITLPAKEEASGLSRRQRGIRRAAIPLIISGVLTPIVGMLTAIESELFVLFLPVLSVFVFGLALLLYALFLEPKSKSKNETGSVTAAARRAKQLNASGRAGLPAAQNLPIADGAKWRQPANTSEMVQPPSVTDHTTKLLKNEAEEK